MSCICFKIFSICFRRSVPEVVKLLLKKGADPSLKLAGTRPLLATAKLIKNNEIIELLESYQTELDLKRDREQKNMDNLVSAIRSNNIDNVQYFLNNGAIDVINKEDAKTGYTPLILAARLDCKEN